MQRSNISHASLILEAFAHFKRRAGEILTTGELIGIARERNWRNDDLDFGIELCLSYGWIEPDDSGEIRRTVTGEQHLPGGQRT